MSPKIKKKWIKENRNMKNEKKLSPTFNDNGIV